MKLIIATTPGMVELNFMWMPTWCGLNSVLKAEIETKISPMLIGKDLTDDLLEEAHEAVIVFLEEKFPNIKGLREYLDGLKFVWMEG
jgi:hypothetical protein